ncbi:MAG: M14 family zinc carboxypeptidase, partial [Gemmatimonadota bacterium]
MTWCPGFHRPLRTMMLLSVPGLLASTLSGQSPGFSRYHSTRQLAGALDSLHRQFPRLVEVTSIAQSPGGRPLSVVRLSAGDAPDTRPALLVIANASGPHVIGSEIALAVLQSMAKGYGSDPAITSLLDRSTIYVIPRANPDAAEAFFENPAVERTRNGLPFDDDRDGSVDEDGPEDLNRDGLITLMRVTDSAGEWTTDSLEPWLMRKARPARGENGQYRVYEEGIDNDHDERWNEDP